jgi:hypothetical protein
MRDGGLYAAKRDGNPHHVTARIARAPRSLSDARPDLPRDRAAPGQGAKAGVLVVILAMPVR